jgi:glycosyltransferase involved in cell wall biosynthesis
MFFFCEEKAKDQYTVSRAKIITYKAKSRVFLKLRRFCIRNSIDILTNLSGNARVAFLLLLSTFLLKTKAFFYNHGNPKVNFVKLRPFQMFFDRLIVCSRDFEKKTKEVYKYVKNRVYGLECAVNTEIFKKKNIDRSKFNLKDNEKVIIYVGRVTKDKGSDYLYEVVNSNKDKTFIFVGEIKDKLFLPLPKNVVHIEKADIVRLSEYYNLADLCIFLSKREGYGFVPREAMSCETPAIVSDITPLNSIKHAIVVPFNINKINQEINHFFNLQRSKRESLGKKSRKFVQDMYSEQALKARTINILTKNKVQ